LPFPHQPFPHQQWASRRPRTNEIGATVTDRADLVSLNYGDLRPVVTAATTANVTAAGSAVIP
jgi:hypothetical protein